METVFQCDMTMPKTLPFILNFLMWLIVFTVLLGLSGIIFPQILSMLVLLPYLLSFFLMAQRFIKKTQQTPNMAQRWQLSIGCATTFWLYSILTGLLGIFIAQGRIDFSAIQHAFSSWAFLLVFSAIFLILNAFLVLLGYWFLGKPTAKMLEHMVKKS